MSFKHYFLLAAFLGLVACGGVDPNSPEGKRQVIFKEMLKHSEDLGGMMRGRVRFDPQQFKEKADELDRITKTPWQYFDHQGDEQNVAKEAIWKEKARFTELAQVMEQATTALATSAGEANVNVSVLQVRIDQVEKACETCHKEFRQY